MGRRSKKKLTLWDAFCFNCKRAYIYPKEVTGLKSLIEWQKQDRFSVKCLSCQERKTVIFGETNNIPEVEKVTQ